MDFTKKFLQERFKGYIHMSAPMYGVVEINGQQYLERWQIIPFQQAMTVNNQVVNASVSLPGIYDFRLKALTRDITAGTPPVSDLLDYRFRCRLGNTDGDIRYSQGGVGSVTDKVLDTLMFGTGQFPYPVIPPIFYGKNASILIELEDLTGAATGSPYNIIMAFHGSYLIPIGS
jgi:hypothetical protein